MIELSNRSSGSSANSVIKLTWLQKRTMLEKHLLLISFIVAVLFIAFFVDSCITSDDNIDRCETYECILAASQVISQVDQHVDPCDDFFKFSCGKMKERTHHKNIPNIMLRTQVKQKIQNILNEPINEDDHQAVKDEKALFQACLNEQENGVSLDMIKSILNKLNGWPVLMGASWNESYFNWPETTIRISEIGLQQSVLHRTYLVEEQNSTRKLIKIRGYLAMSLEKKHHQSVKEFLVQCAMFFGAKQSEANKEMEEVFQFDMELAKISFVEYNSSNTKINQNIAMADFQRDYPQINWISYFNGVLYPNNITMEEYVSLPYSNYMDEFFSLLNNTSKRTIANHMIWYAMLELLPFAGKSYLDLMNQLGCVYEHPKIDSASVCRRAMSQIFSPRPSALIFAKKYVSVKTRKKIKIMFEQILMELKNVLEDTPWLDFKNLKNITDWVNNVTVLVAEPEGGINKIYDKYTKLNIMHKPFVKFFLEIKKQRMIQTSHIDRATKYEFLYYLVPRTDIIYLRPDHTIMIPSGFLQGMYFNQHWPMYLNFGGLGKAIGTALSFQLLTDSELHNDELWSEEINKVFENITDCIIHDSEDFRSLEKFYFKNLKMAEILGIKLAYQAYRRWTFGNERDPSLLGLDYTSDQLFWIWAFSNGCYDESEHTDANLLSDNEVVKQNIFFAGDFKCKLDSKMNPINKCIIF